MIDTHTHLDSPRLAADIDAVMERAGDAGVTHCFLPNVDEESLPRMQALQAKFPDQIRLMLGLHPCDVKGDWMAILDRYEAMWKKDPTQFIAVGEIGLDLYWDKDSLDEQLAALHRQLDWAITYDKPFSMHVRDAWEPMMDVLRQRACPELKGVLHCFTASTEIAKECIELGLTIGVGGVTTFKNAQVIAVLQNIGLDHVVLETDSPYLAPTPHRGKRNESSYLKLVATHIADNLNMTLEEVDAITTANARRIFQP